MAISIHAPTRGATYRILIWRLKLHISIHAPTRGATHLTELLDPFTVISIHAPTRGATFAAFYFFMVFQQISIHAPTRGATKQSPPYTVIHNNFNPRSHKGTTRQFFQRFNVTVISIHAPTRGATLTYHQQ